MRRRKRMLKDLDDDIRDYLEQETQDNKDRGMPAEEARFAALRKLGNVRRVKEETWKVWSIEWLECLLQDFRFALRSLRKAPGHTASVVLTLALGLGSVATMLAIVDSVLLRPVAIPRPHELVMLYLNSGQTWDAWWAHLVADSGSSTEQSPLHVGRRIHDDDQARRDIQWDWLGNCSSGHAWLFPHAECPADVGQTARPQ